MDWANGIKQPPTHKTADEDDLKEEKVKAPNENLLDDNSGLPQGVPFGMQSNTKDIWKPICINSTI